MWPFSKRYSIASSGILQGFTDWHSHLLPGVDDGVRTMEESLNILASYEQFGVREVWLTPHIMEDIPNTTASLRSRYAELKSAYKGRIVLHLASENMLDNLFEERLQQDDLLPLGEDGKLLLVETSYFNPPYALHDILRRIKEKGYTPVLAHPERYVYMDQKDYEQLKTLDMTYQLNLPSLAGVYGADAKRKAKWLLENRYYRYLGTDTHRLSTWESVVHEKRISKDVVQML
ncbi:MAG: tyrosine-protein phosphatase [Prevotella sp.]